MTKILTMVVLAAVLTGCGAKKEAEEAARRAYVPALMSISYTRSTADLTAKLAGMKPTAENKAKAQEARADLRTAEDKLEVIRATWRKACEACATDTLCREEEEALKLDPSFTRASACR